MIAFICLAIFGAWLLLEIEIAEVILILIVIGSAALAICWLCLGSWDTETAKGIRIFALMVVTVGLVRLAVEKLSVGLLRKLRR